MNKLDPQVEVAQIVTERPSAARVFERYGIDYCCGGRQPLVTACQARGINVDDVLSELARAVQSPCDKNLQELSLTELANHIVALHHEFLRQTLPTLTRQVDRVAQVHGAGHPEMVEVRGIFHDFVAEMYDHMDKEEQILFPTICGQEARHCERGAGCSVAQIIKVMESEHDSAGRALETIRRLTHDYAIPPEACTTYRAVLQGLAELEEDMHRHVHAENYVLFPRAIAAAN